MLVAYSEPGGPLELINAEERRRLNDLEGQVINVMPMLDSTDDTILSFLQKYNQFRLDFGEGPEKPNNKGLITFNSLFKKRKWILILIERR